MRNQKNTPINNPLAYYQKWPSQFLQVANNHTLADLFCNPKLSCEQVQNLLVESVKRLIDNPNLFENEVDVLPCLHKMDELDRWRIERYLTDPRRYRFWLLNTACGTILSSIRVEQKQQAEWKERYGYCPIVVVIPPENRLPWMRNAVVIDLYLSDSKVKDPTLFCMDREFANQIQLAQTLFQKEDLLPFPNGLSVWSPTELRHFILQDESAGLAFAMATYLFGCGQELSAPVVFTAKLDDQLGIKPVDGVSIKIRATIDRGMACFYYGSLNEPVEAKHIQELSETTEWKKTIQAIHSGLVAKNISFLISWPKWNVRKNELDKMSHNYEPYKSIPAIEQVFKVAQKVHMPEFFLGELEGVKGRLFIHSGQQTKGIKHVSTMMRILKNNQFDLHEPMDYNSKLFSYPAPLLDLLYNPSEWQDQIEPYVVIPTHSYSKEQSRLGSGSLWFYLQALWAMMEDQSKAKRLFQKSYSYLKKKIELEQWKHDLRIDPIRNESNRKRTLNDASMLRIALNSSDCVKEFQPEDLCDAFSWSSYIRAKSWLAWINHDQNEAKKSIDLIMNEAQYWLAWPTVPFETTSWLGRDGWHLAANMARSLILAYITLNEEENCHRIVENTIKALKSKNNQIVTEEEWIPAARFRVWSTMAMGYYAFPNSERYMSLKKHTALIQATHGLIKQHKEFWIPKPVLLESLESRCDRLSALIKICYY